MMNKPTRSYRIWFTQRSGSSLLCKAIESTGIAGIPGEYFTLMGEEQSLLDKHHAHTYPELKEKLWKMGSTPNGVFGLKVPLHWERYMKIYTEVADLREMQAENHETVWEDLFPNCQHIYLTRRNKVRQVVSWWRAIQDQVWHLENGKKHRNEESFYEERYDFAALTHLFKESVLMECAAQQYFDQHHIVPKTVVYEDFIKNYEATVLDIVEFLGLETGNVQVGQPFYSKTADELSDIWVDRFRKDFQEGFGEVVY